MCTGVSTKQKLMCELTEIDGILKALLDKVNKKSSFDDFEHLVLLLLEKDGEIKKTLKDVNEQLKLQRKIDKLRSDCANSDIQIQNCQKQLKKSELLLSTALYYCRQKLDSMVNSVKNPIDVDELTKFSHRISCSHGVLAPDNWTQGDPRRPYPNKAEITRGYLGCLDDSGKFRPTLEEALAQVNPVVVNTPSSALATPGGAGSTPAAMRSNLHQPGTFSNQIGLQSHHSGPLGSGNGENSSTFSSSIVLPGVNMVSSPANVPPSNGAGTIPGANWAPEHQGGRQANSLSSIHSGQAAGRAGASLPPPPSPVLRLPTQGPTHRTSGSPSPGTSANSRPQTPTSVRNWMTNKSNVGPSGQQMQQQYTVEQMQAMQAMQQRPKRPHQESGERMYSDSDSDDAPIGWTPGK